MARKFKENNDITNTILFIVAVVLWISIFLISLLFLRTVTSFFVG